MPTIQGNTVNLIHTDIRKIEDLYKTQKSEKALPMQQLLQATPKNPISSRPYSGKYVKKTWEEIAALIWSVEHHKVYTPRLHSNSTGYDYNHSNNASIEVHSYHLLARMATIQNLCINFW